MKVRFKFMRFNVEEAEEKFELLMAMACNGDLVLIQQRDDVVRLEPVPETLIPGKVWTAEDFYDVAN
jgi:hypothetical protein